MAFTTGFTMTPWLDPDFLELSAKVGALPGAVFGHDGFHVVQWSIECKSLPRKCWNDELSQNFHLSAAAGILSGEVHSVWSFIYRTSVQGLPVVTGIPGRLGGRCAQVQKCWGVRRVV
jgi:hypothetical protein